MSSIVGVIASTNGIVRAAALEALGASDHIVHAGDIGSPDVLEALSTICPVTAVRGKNDTGPWAEPLSRTEIVEVESVRLYVIHDLAELDLDPAAAKVHAIIEGHSHMPSIEKRDGVLYLNPGSAGTQHFNLPITVARLHVHGLEIEPEIVHCYAS